MGPATDHRASRPPRARQAHVAETAHVAEPAHAVELATGVVLLTGLVGLPSDRFLVPVNAALFTDPFGLLVVPGAARAPWWPALVAEACHIDHVVSLSGCGRDLDLTLERLPHARVLDATNRSLASAGLGDRFELIAAPGVRSGAHALRCHDLAIVLSGDALGAVVRHRVHDVDELDPPFWHAGLRAHAAWAGTYPRQARRALGDRDALVVPSFGPVVPAHRVSEALDALAHPWRADPDHASALDHLTGRPGGW